jgi:thiamine biosynthesis lipoprotein
MKLIRNWLLPACFLVVIPPAISRKPFSTRFEFVQPHMGTRFRIVLYASHDLAGRRAAQAAFERIAALDTIMSDYRSDSELMGLCRQAGGPPVRISEDLFRVLAAAQEVSRRSDGAFDVTVGPVVRLWRMARLSHQLPDPARLEQARELVDYRKVRLDPGARTAQLLAPGMVLDLGGIAKGRAADEALRVLRQCGISSALVAGGGDIAVGDPPPGKAGWTIGIAPLEAPEKPPRRYLQLHNAAISTSGDAEQHVEIAGVRYSHVVNPNTGQALTGRRSVTVIARDCTTSDALSTAASVLGPGKGLELVKSTPGTSMLFAVETRQGVRTYEWQFPPSIAPQSRQ